MKDVHWDEQGAAGLAHFILCFAWGGQELRLLSRNQGGLRRVARVEA